MKYLKIILVTFIILTSCEIDNTDSIVVANPVINENNVLQTTIVQGSFDFTSIDLNTSASLTNDTLIIVAGDGNSFFNFEIKQFDGTGFYEIMDPTSEEGVEATYTIRGVDTQPNRIWNAVIDDTDPDEIIITSVTDTAVEGTFIFSAENMEEGSVIDFVSGVFTFELN